MSFCTTYKEHYFNDKNRGDGGIDLVAWKQFSNDDNNLNIALYLGQCATGKDWIKNKMMLISLKIIFIFKVKLQIFFFIHYDGRDRNRDFTEEKDINISKNILFDRVRLLNTIDIDYDISQLKSYKLIQSAIDFEEDII